MNGLVLFGIFTVCLLLSVPIAMSLGIASIVTILSLEPVSMSTFNQAVTGGLNSFPIMAIPLFSFAGEIMGKGGLSKRLINVIKVFVGNITGGIGIVVVVTCLFFAAISGTGSATVAAIGLIMIPQMVKQGYDKAFSGALVASAGTVGVMIPPSVAMVIYAVVANTSVISMFMAGIVPGILVGIALMIYTYFYARKHNYKGEKRKYTLSEILKLFIEAIPALLVPVIILGGIYGGVFTPTEAAAFACVYGIIVSVFIYKEVKIKELPYIGFNSAMICMAVLIIIGIAKGFGTIIIIAQVPQIIAGTVLSVIKSKVAVLLLINLILLIVGTFMDTNSAIIILTPILLPIASSFGITPVHFGIIMILNLAVGFITPPVGANLFMACQVGKINFDDLAKKILPWILILIIVLMVVTFVPGISTWLPQTLGKSV